LDRYQEQCGWEVRERNAECRVWDFEKTDDKDDQGDSSSSSSNKVPSICPMGPAYVRRCANNQDGRRGSDENSNKHSDRYDSRGAKRKFPRSYGTYNASAADSRISERVLEDFSFVSTINDSLSYRATSTTSEENKDNKANHKDSTASKTESAVATESIVEEVIETNNNGDVDGVMQQPLDRCDNLGPTRNEYSRPYVSIRGMVDGIRDEFGPTSWTPQKESKDNNKNTREFRFNNDNDDDFSCDSYSLSRVVVECKHRMRALLLNGPRFSECIQAVVYCFMYEADDADIVQVLRLKNTNSDAKGRIKNDENQEQPNRSMLTDYFNKVRVVTGGHVNSDDTVKKKYSKCMDVDQKRKESWNRVTMKIAVDRVSLDDPHYGHRANWKDVILPKLRRWVDAVYRIRQSDDKRYRLLTAMAMAADSAAVAPALPSHDESSSGQANNVSESQHRRDHLRSAWYLVFEECDFLRDGMSGERYRIETH